MLDFLRKLGRAFYAATLGGLVRLVRNTRVSKVDDVDKQFLGRVLVYVSLAIVALFAPQLAVLLGLLRFIALGDVFRTLADVYQLTVNAYFPGTV